MKHVYYGIKRESFIFINRDTICKLEECVFYYGKHYRDRVESDIKRLRDNLDTFYVMKPYKEVDNQIFIAEKNHDHVCEKNQKIKIGKHEGTIRDTKYDAENDIMYYFTDINVIDVEGENIESELSKAREYVINELQKILKYCQNAKREEKEKKGFWKRLFS